MIAHEFAAESPGWTLALALAGAAAALYCRGWLRVRRRLPEIASPWHPTAFLGGLVALWIAAGSPLAACDGDLLTFHMVQHLLLTTVAAPLILLGAPALPLLYGFPDLVRLRGLAPALRWQPVRAVSRVLGQPAVCWAMAMIVFLGWHIPATFELGRRSMPWHVFEQATFFASGLLFWWPVIQPWPSTPALPRWSVPLYLFLATLPCDALSAFLAFSDRVIYPAYLSVPRHFGLSALQDQEQAGALMWLVVTIAYVLPAGIIMISVLSPKRAYSSQPSRDSARVTQVQRCVGERGAS
jgi:putative membrane protein